ncbi:MAG: hydrogenase small subunit [Methermicoccaceae archaeon]
MVNLVWLQGGGCSGCSVSFLNAEQPDIPQVIERLGVAVSYHSTVMQRSGQECLEDLDKMAEGDVPIDILVVEGTIPLGPNDTGRFCMIGDRPFKDIVEELSKRSTYTVAVGSCACWGGIPAAGTNPLQHVGVQFSGEKKGGLLGPAYLSEAGLPVINLPGCPVHPDWVVDTVAAVLLGKGEFITLDEFNRPTTHFGYYVHEGCLRNEFYDWKLDPEHLGDVGGCLYWKYGCKAPWAHADCNKILWNNKLSSCTRVGAPCLGCVEPGFPDSSTPFFKRLDIPTTGAKKIAYMGGAALMMMARPKEMNTHWKPKK